MFFRFLPVQLTVGLILGVLFGSYFSIDPIQLSIFSGTSLIALVVVYFYTNKQFEPSFLFTVIVFLISCVIGISSVTFNCDSNKKSYFANQSAFSLNKPQTIVISIKKVLKRNQYYYKYEAEVFQLNKQSTIGKVLVNVEKDSTKNRFKVDDQFLVNTSFKTINSPLNPYGFNYQKYLHNQQVDYQINIDKDAILDLENSKSSVNGLAASFREKINNSLIKYGFKDNELAVINALLLGQRQTISSDLMQSYTGAGAIHILAVSGLHVGIILLILTFLFKPFHYFKKGKLIASICIVVSLWLFAIIAGLSASVVRAVTMFTAITIGLYLNRPSNIYNTLITSMFFLLLFHPSYLFEVGFQLSYVAVFAIVWIQPKIYNLWKPKYWLLNKIWQLFTVSIAAQIGVLPLSLYYFHQFPGLFFISNLVIIPVLGIILILGILVMLFAVFGILPQFLAKGYMLLINTMNSFVSWVSNQESFIVQNITFSLVLLIVSYLFVIVFFKWSEKKTFKRAALVLTSIIVVQLVFVYEKYERQSTNEFIVFQKSKESVFGKRIGEHLQINTSINSFSSSEQPLKDYVVGTGIDKVSIKNEIQNLYAIKKNKIVVIDSLGIYKFKSIDNSILVLRQSPKVNLDRLLKILNPKLIVVDGSNYKSYVEMWKKTCLKNKTPFYSTLQNGAYILK